MMLRIITGFICCVFAQPCTAQSAENKQVPGIDTIILNVNENRYFEAELDTVHPLQFREVPTVTNPAKTVTIQLVNNQGTGAMLKIYNPFSYQLVYKAELYSYKKKDFIATSTVPVYPKISSFETWPYKIDRIRLSGFKLTQSD